MSDANDDANRTANRDANRERTGSAGSGTDTGSGQSDAVDVCLSQLDGVAHHCEAAREALVSLQSEIGDAGSERALDRAFGATSSLRETCRSIRTNTFDALHRQLSKLVVASPDDANDLSADRLDATTTEIVTHHRRLMALVDDLAAVARGTDPTSIASQGVLSNGADGPTGDGRDTPAGDGRDTPAGDGRDTPAGDGRDTPAGDGRDTHAGDGRDGDAIVLEMVDSALSSVRHVKSSADHLRCLLRKRPSNAASTATASESDPVAFEVTGTIRQAGEPVEGVTVRAVDVDVGGEQRLGESTTDDTGQYRIEYVRGDFERAERATADLTVRVTDVAGRRLAASSTSFNVERHTRVDVAVPDDVTVAPAVYDRLRAELRPLLDGRSVRDLDDSTIAFLAGEVDLVARSAYPDGVDTLEWLRTASTLAPRTPFERPILFALASQLDELDRETLADADVGVLASAVQSAVEERVVDRQQGDVPERLERRQDALARAYRLENGTERRETVTVTSTDGTALADYPVLVEDRADERSRAVFRTDDQGRVPLAYTSTSDDDRAFDVTVLSDDGTRLHEDSVTLDGTGGTVTGVDAIRTRSDATDSDLDHAAVGNEDLDTARTFATMDLATDVQPTTALAGTDYTDQTAIADTDLATFQATMNETIDPATARTLHHTARAQTYALDSLLTARRSDVRNGHGLVGGRSGTTAGDAVDSGGGDRGE